MSQLNLFKAERHEIAPRPSNPEFVRKHLLRLLNLARAAERLPWSPAEARSWAELFPKLTESLPADEGQALREAFSAELARLDESLHGGSEETSLAQAADADPGTVSDYRQAVGVRAG